VVENLISPFTHNTKENRKILFDQTILLFDSFSSALVRKVVIPLGKFQNKWGPVRYDAAGTTGQRKIWWLGLSNIADASVSQMWNTYFYSRLNFYDA